MQVTPEQQQASLRRQKVVLKTGVVTAVGLYGTSLAKNMWTPATQLMNLTRNIGLRIVADQTYAIGNATVPGSTLIAARNRIVSTLISQGVPLALCITFFLILAYSLYKNAAPANETPAAKA